MVVQGIASYILYCIDNSTDNSRYCVILWDRLLFVYMYYIACITFFTVSSSARYCMYQCTVCQLTVEFIVWRAGILNTPAYIYS